jgi:hypothetical protein
MNPAASPWPASEGKLAAAMMIKQIGTFSGCPLAGLLVALLVIPAGRCVAQATRPATMPALNLPVIHLEVPAAIPPDGRVECSMKLLPAGRGEADQVGPWIGTIRLRGASSRAHPKKSYAVALEAPVELLGMRSHRNWILNAAYIDRSLMRHKLSYDLFRSLDAPDRQRFAVASRFVEVHLNGHYQGVYLLMERIDRELLGFAPHLEGETGQACIYKAYNHDAGFFHPGQQGFEQQEPDPLSIPWWEPLENLMQYVQSTPPADLLHPDTGIARRFDLDNAIDFHLLVLLTQNTDGITKNFYLAQPQLDEQAGHHPPPFFFVPWDFDATFGRNWNSSRLPANLWLSNGLFDRLLRDPGYRERFAARWEQLRQNQFSQQTILAMIDANVAELGQAAARNLERWPTSRPPYHDRITFEEDIQQMKAWVPARLEWLDQQIASRAAAERRRRPGR